MLSELPARDLAAAQAQLIVFSCDELVEGEIRIEFGLSGETTGICCSGLLTLLTQSLNRGQLACAFRWRGADKEIDLDCLSQGTGQTAFDCGPVLVV